jgi:hypothetical protein
MRALQTKMHAPVESDTVPAAPNPPPRARERGTQDLPRGESPPDGGVAQPREPDS